MTLEGDSESSMSAYFQIPGQHFKGTPAPVKAPNGDLSVDPATLSTQHVGLKTADRSHSKAIESTNGTTKMSSESSKESTLSGGVEKEATVVDDSRKGYTGEERLEVAGDLKTGGSAGDNGAEDLNDVPAAVEATDGHVNNEEADSDDDSECSFCSYPPGECFYPGK